MDPAAPPEQSASPHKGESHGYPCVECGGKTRFLPGTESLQCLFCNLKMPIERGAQAIVEHSYDEALVAHAKVPVESLSVGAREIECKTCGARSVVTEHATRCAFCDASVIVEVPVGDVMVLPESVLPFEIDGKDAQGKFLYWLDGLWFAPFRLRKHAKTLPIDGVYLPYWTYDTNTQTGYRGERGDYYYVTVSYRDAQGRSQTRQERRTRWSAASGQVFVHFDDTLVCGSRSIPQEMATKLEPWDLGSLAPYNGRYLAGFIAERYGVDLVHGFAVAESKMEPAIRCAIRSDIGGDEQRINQMDVAYSDRKYKHVLLPLWLSAFRYKEKVFRVMVNARTGEVTGQRPYSALKIAFAVLLGLAVLGGIIYWWSLAQR